MSDEDDTDDDTTGQKAELTVKSGCGCFLAAVGLAVAFAIFHWASSGFPQFWK